MEGSAESVASAVQRLTEQGWVWHSPPLEASYGVWLMRVEVEAREHVLLPRPYRFATEPVLGQDT